MCALRTYAFVQFRCCFWLGSQAKSWGMTGIFASGVFELLKWAGKFDWSKGLFINDVITFGGYPDPPPPPCHHVMTKWCHQFWGVSRPPPSPSSDDVIYEQPLTYTICIANTALLYCCTRLYWAVLGNTGLYWPLLDCAWLYWAVLDCIGLYWAVLGKISYRALITELWILQRGLLVENDNKTTRVYRHHANFLACMQLVHNDLVGKENWKSSCFWRATSSASLGLKSDNCQGHGFVKGQMDNSL